MPARWDGDGGGDGGVVYHSKRFLRNKKNNRGMQARRGAVATSPWRSSRETCDISTDAQLLWFRPFDSINVGVRVSATRAVNPRVICGLSSCCSESVAYMLLLYSGELKDQASELPRRPGSKKQY